MNTNPFEVSIKHDLTMQEITDIVITAFEGGISYWCNATRPALFVGRNGTGIYHYRKPTDEEYERFKIDGVGAYANPEFWSGGHGYNVFDDEGNSGLITAQVLATAIGNQPRERLARLINPGDYDIDDADAVIQTAVFGEIVYG